MACCLGGGPMLGRARLMVEFWRLSLGGGGMLVPVALALLLGLCDTGAGTPRVEALPAARD